MEIQESALRGGVFAGSLLIWALAESLWPQRSRRFLRRQRWFANLGLALIGTGLLRALALLGVPLLALQVALWAQASGIGLFNRIDAPGALEFVLTLLLLDLLVWAQHLAFHRLPWLWRLHRVHHADRELDVSSGLRFHPLEILLSMLLKSAAVLVLGAPAVAVLVFELILNGMAMFNHANLRLPAMLDRALRGLVVTPDVHRVHHSIHADEQQQNFGFNLSLWDRLAGCYRAGPRDGHQAMQLGLQEFQDDQPLRLHWSLQLPWRPLARTGPEPGQSS